MCDDVANTIQDFVQEDEFQVFAEIMNYVLTTEKPLKPEIKIGAFLERRCAHTQHVVQISLVVTPEREIEEIIFNGHFGHCSMMPSEYYDLPTQTVCYNLARIFCIVVFSRNQKTTISCMETFAEYKETTEIPNWSREPVKFEFHRKRLGGPADAIMKTSESVFDPELERKLRCVLSENDLEAIDTLYPIFKQHLMGLVGTTETRTAYHWAVF